MKSEKQLKQKRYTLRKELRRLRERKLSAKIGEVKSTYERWEFELIGQIKIINWTLNG